MSRPELCAAFFDLLPKIEKDATDLFILGDFFNFWVGDDIATSLTQQVSDALSQLADKGIHVYFQHGNRDFAVGQKYADLCKMRIIPEVYTIPFTPNIILLHGDQLCLSDVQYLRYRAIIRHPIILGLLRRLPRVLRLRLGLKLREASKKNQARRCPEDACLCCDVPAKEVDRILQAYHANIMIHGHTHKPNVHQHNHGVRWVLSDWETTGDYLRWDAKQGLTRYTFNIPADS